MNTSVLMFIRAALLTISGCLYHWGIDHHLGILFGGFLLGAVTFLGIHGPVLCCCETYLNLFRRMFFFSGLTSSVFFVVYQLMTVLLKVLQAKSVSPTLMVVVVSFLTLFTVGRLVAPPYLREGN